MPALRLFIGGEFFRDIRERDCYYVDKTGLLEELLLQSPPQVSLFTRPRRFGKTLMMTMMRDFFDIQQDSRSIFEGLAVSRNAALCDAWMNQYPVVFISMKRVEGLSFKDALDGFRELITLQGVELAYLLQSPKISSGEKEMLQAIWSRTDDKSLLESSIQRISKALHAHWGKPAILLIDEYDVPLARAEQNGYYDEMVSFLRNMLGAALKTNPSLKLAVLTGCLRIAKESIFTGLNNFKNYGISDPKFADKFGFTVQEVDALLAEAQLSHKKDVMREWFDGYRFGRDQEIYCPWDILQYVDDLQTDPDARPQAYWSNTSGNSIVRRFVDRGDLHVGHKFETLLSGGCIEADISETLTYDAVHASEDNLWTVLYLSGYLTRASRQQQEQCGFSPDSELTPLVIPNKEIRKIFTSSIAAWFKDSVRKADRTELFHKIWEGDAAALSDLLTEQLYATISYYDAHEDYYHAFVAGMFSFSRYDVRSNDESGNGRPDILIFDMPNRRAVIMELKVAAEYADMQEAAEAALRQIEEKKYASGLPPRVTQVLKYGVAFCKKECLVLRQA
ncbi:MAG: AAA family ATPase [Mailhella sp.]|nr:AAA family ATPase [Mailhella sp.]MBQ8744460.1 AAA family ATPase [Mailhella sp.]